MIFKREFVVPLIGMIWFVFTFPALWLLDSMLLIFSPSYFDLQYSFENLKYVIKRNEFFGIGVESESGLKPGFSFYGKYPENLPKHDFLFNHFIVNGMVALGCLLADLLVFVGVFYLLWN